MVRVKRALISVSDKKDLEDFVKGLNKYGVEMLSTGGTAKLISGAGVPVKQVSDYTGYPEMLDGRVKTLHPKIHGGLLALREKEDHMGQLKKNGIGLIELEEVIENIDIGGPSMLRSGAKNYRSVAIVCNPDRYKEVLDEMDKNDGTIGDAMLEKLAVEVFEHTSKYDTAIAGYLGRKLAAAPAQPSAQLPDTLKREYQKAQNLRYGENPAQKAAFYKDTNIDEPSVSTAKQLHGKELSFNNILDLDAAIEIVKDFPEPAVSVIKHTNPCGAATSDDLKKAFVDALDSDRQSAFGSIIGLNRVVDEATAKTVLGESDFVECIIAPSYDKKALEILKTKKNLRILEVPGFDKKSARTDLDMKKVVGGFLVQERDLNDDFEPKVVTKKKPTKEQLKSLLFGWKIAKHVKSNAIVLTQGTKTVGVGAGQMSRVDSVIIASRKAGKLAKESCLSSDAFFPKEDAIQMAKEAGVVAIIQPGGSIRDAQVIEAADKACIAMVFTGLRHFKH